MSEPPKMGETHIVFGAGAGILRRLV